MSIKTTRPVENAAKLGGQLPGYYMPKSGGVFTGEVTVPGQFTVLKGEARFVIRPGALGDWSGHILDNMGQASQIVNATNHVVHNTYPLRGNAFQCGNTNYPWSSVVAQVIQPICGSAEKREEYEVGTEQAEEIIELLSQLPLRVYRRYKNADGKRILGDELELGVFIDDIKDHPLYGLLGCVDENHETGEPIYSLNLMAWSTAAHVRAEYAIQKAEKAERESTALKALLVEKGVCTQEEIDGLE